MSGYVRLYRSLIDHPAFRNDAESMAFAWMIARASWAARRVRYKERGIHLQRGQLAISQRDMARAMDRDKAWVERLWKRLKSEAMIEVACEAGVAVITICNYGEYQAEVGAGEAADKAPRKAEARQRRGTEQEREEGKKEAIASCLRKAFPTDPEWLPDSFAEFRAMRKKMRNVPFGDEAERRCIAKLDTLRGEGHDPEKLISKAIENGHRTFFPDDSTKRTGTSAKQTPEEQIANLKKSIEFFTRMGRDDDVRECRRKIAALEGQQPSPVASLVRQAARGMAA